MSDTLLVKISRDGKEFGTYEAKEAVRLLLNGTLKGKDFYWHDGMTEWAPLLKFESSETFRLFANNAKAKAELEERAKRKADEDAISATARDLWIKKRAGERLDENRWFFWFLESFVFFLAGRFCLKLWVVTLMEVPLDRRFWLSI